MRSDAEQPFRNGRRGFVSDVVEVDGQPCTTARNAAREAPGAQKTLWPSADMERLVATVGLKLTPWQRRLLAGMFDHGKIRPISLSPRFMGGRCF